MATRLFNLTWLKTQTGRDLDSDVNSTTLALGEKTDGTQGAFTFFQGIKNFFKGVTALGSLTTSGKLAVINTSTGEVNYITVEDLISFGLDDTTTVANKTWSSSKINNELSDKADVDELLKYLKQHPYRPPEEPYNANIIYTQGVYRGYILNTPNQHYGVLMCLPYRSEQGSDKPDFGVQLFFENGDATTAGVYYRLSLAESWLSWGKIPSISVSLAKTNPTEQNNIKE